MKLKTIALVIAFALSSTFALAQAGGASSSGASGGTSAGSAATGKRDWLDVERQHDGNRRRFGNFSE